MKINCFPKILFGIYILMFCKLSFAFDGSVATKYNDIFTQNILHGNVVNKEKTSRWSFNCRSKSLLSPYSGKTIGDFFSPITLRPAIKLGIDYVPPKFKK